MPRASAGLLPYRRQDERIDVFLVHPGGRFWAGKDEHVWSIAKGEVEPLESLLAAARREFSEETGLHCQGSIIPLTARRQPGGKVVHAWAVETDCDAGAIRSNAFRLEWPPHSGQIQQFPEIDRAAWFDIATAREKIHEGQVGFLDELEARLKALEK